MYCPWIYYKICRATCLRVVNLERPVPTADRDVALSSGHGHGRLRDDILRKHPLHLPPITAAPHPADVLEALLGAGLGHTVVVACADERHPLGHVEHALGLMRLAGTPGAAGARRTQGECYEQLSLTRTTGAAELVNLHRRALLHR